MSHRREVVGERGHALDAAARLERDHRPVPLAAQLARRERVVGVRLEARVADPLDALVAPRGSGRSRAAFSEPFAERSGSVRTPRRTRNDENGLAAWPNVSVCLRIGSSRRFGPETTPETASPCPDRYFVAAWRTRSAPCSIGRSSAGPRNVLSATTSSPWRWPISASAAMSGIRSRGFVDVSKNRIFVRSVIAASTAARSVMSTGVTSIPRRGRSSSHSTLVIDEQLVAHHEVVALRRGARTASPPRTPCPTPRRRSPRRPRARRPSPRARGSSGCPSASRSTRSGPTRARASTAASLSAAVSNANVAVA